MHIQVRYTYIYMFSYTCVCIKFFLFVQVSNLVILLVNDPDIVDREDDVGLLSLYDFSNPLHAKGFRLVPVGRREHFVSVL